MGKNKQIGGFVFLAALIGLIAYENHNDERKNPPATDSADRKDVQQFSAPENNGQPFRGLPASASGDDHKQLKRYHGHDGCWGVREDEDDRPDVTCQNLSLSNIMSLAGATKQDVIKFMRVPGKYDAGTHFLSNDVTPGHYSGYINFTYENNKVSVISAIVTKELKGGGIGDEIHFIWNPRMGGCSDFPGSTNRCTNSEN